VIFGSLIAYTAYVWLLERFSATRVSSRAYVNPLIAVGLDHFVAGEVVTVRSIVASFIIVASVLLILTKPPMSEAGGWWRSAASRNAP
jgi:drug/metabolite transporter (DMT)-like permease